MYIFEPICPDKVNYPVFAEQNGMSGDIVLKYFIHKLITSENIFSLACEKGIIKKASGLYALAESEIENIVKTFKDYDPPELFRDYVPLKAAEEDITEEFCEIFENASALTNRLAKFYRERGCGLQALYKGFRLTGSGELVPVKAFDPISLDNIFCYDYQKKALLDNTVSFLEGKPARNVLLTGARGTGKSSSVKALVNRFQSRGLRLIEVPKERTHYLPEIMHKLSDRGLKFIIFIDDLSFEAEETSYKYLKSVLEGSAESKPSNVVFYATSNRRHIIAEKWEDRGDISQKGELHTMDQLNEKMSLSDRFGLKLTFSRPGPKEYLEIVKGIAKEHGLEADEELIAAAKAFELSAGGRSGRTARQFVESLICGGDDS